MSPVDPHFLALLAPDARDSHPDRRRTGSGVPGLDLEVEGLSGRRGESEVLSARAGLGEVKPWSLEADQQRERLQGRAGRQVGPVGGRQDEQRAGMLPAGPEGGCGHRAGCGGMGRGQGVPLPGHAFHAVRMPRRQVGGLGAVPAQVVEFPGRWGACGDDLPVALPQRPVALVLPPQGFGPPEVGVPGERRDEAATGRQGHARGWVLRWPIQSGQFQRRRDEVHQMARRGPEGAAIRDASGPMDDQWSRDASFMNPGLVSPERRVGQG